jgi:hypothetical protein
MLIWVFSREKGPGPGGYGGIDTPREPNLGLLGDPGVPPGMTPGYAPPLWGVEAEAGERR